MTDYATLAQRELYSRQQYGLVKGLPELDTMFEIDVPGTGSVCATSTG